MCFYTQQNAPKKNVKARFNAKIDIEENFIETAEMINGFSFPNIPVILDKTPDIINTDFNWGLIPYWSKDEEIRKQTLNARIETIEEKVSFRNVVNNRCLIISTAYYEWRWNDEKGKVKEKYQINSQDDEIFTFAGLYDSWVNPQTGLVKHTFTMLTTEANHIMQFVHNHKKRMPIMLKKSDESAWLDNSNKISKFAFPYQSNLIAFKTQ